MLSLRRPGAGVVAVALALAGTTLTVLAWRAPAGIPPPPAPHPASSSPTAGPARRAPAVGRSVPLGLEIPAIGVQIQVVPIGLRPDRTLSVPPLRADAPAGWYDQSPTPGETGSSVIAGHVDSAHDGPAAFYLLRLLQRGDRIVVGRADGSTVQFAVTGLALVAKAAFPTARVYGSPGYPALTLITCGGRFDRSHGSYRDNLVVFTVAVQG